MRSPFTGSLQRKLLGVALLTTLTALLVALGAIVAYNVRVYHLELLSDMSTQAELLGHMTAPALSFDDKKLATENLGQLRARPSVRAAAIYTARGALFATYVASPAETSFPALPEGDAVHVDARTVTVFKRIVVDGEILGTVYIRADYGLARRVVDYAAIAAIAAIAGLATAFLLSLRLQRAITAPIVSIADIAREVVRRRDYSRRAQKTSSDEVGVLVDAFNDMLTEIERRTGELEESYTEIAKEATERTRAQQEVMRLNQDLEMRVRDRTAELEIANQELAIAKAAADKSNQAKSTFLSNMSHELRTPLNAILGFGQLLQAEDLVTTPAQQSEFVGHIVNAGEHLLALINEVLDLAKVESGTVSLSMEPVALVETLEEVRTMIEPIANKRNIRLVFPRHTDLDVIADRIRLKQVLLNLLSNAVKYNRDGGTVIVSQTRIAPDRVRVEVQDTGAGLAPEAIAQLFQPFNRLGQETGPQEGTGIGLVVTRRLVELMDGSIGVTSTPGVGSVFSIEMKCAARKVDAATASAPGAVIAMAVASVPVDPSQRRVLYVEDNPANLRLVKEILAYRSDVFLWTAADAHLGIELARAHQPEVILMDINLPGMSGIDALTILRNDSRTADIPVIALTANAMPRDVEKGNAFGFFRYLTKPINIAAFFEALDSALAFSGDRRSARSAAVGSN
ncbi:MAG TPA: ATP-binding protein [Casimicrobiaceae bacterium]|nr:ATP-binding protein [Casimicrobiaceae bacterium]